MLLGLIDAVLGTLELCHPPPTAEFEKEAACPVVIIRVTNCPDIIIPFLTPQELAEHSKKVQAGHVHLPLAVEESYINCGNFIFNRGRTVLFAVPEKSELSANCGHATNLSATEDEILKRFLELKKPELKVDLNSSYDSEYLYERIRKRLSKEKINDSTDISIVVRTEIVDISKTPILLLGKHEFCSIIRLNDNKLKPLIKDNIVLSLNGIPFGNLGLAVTVQLFQKKYKRSYHASNFPIHNISSESIIDAINSNVVYRNNLCLERAISKLISKSSKKWKSNILYENPYIIEYIGGSNRTTSISKIYKNLACYLDNDYIEAESSEDDGYEDSVKSPKKTNRVYFEKENVVNLTDYNEKDKLSPKYLHKHPDRKNSEQKSKIFVEDVISHQSKSYSKIKVDSNVISSTNPSGWLGHPTKLIRKKNPVIQQTRTTFLRRMMVDSELEKHIKREVERKIQEKMESLPTEYPVRKLRIKKKFPEDKRDSAMQTDNSRRMSASNKSTSMGSSFQVTQDHDESVEPNHNIREPSRIGISGDNVVGNRHPMERSNTKESAATLEKINSLNDETADLSRVSNQNSQKDHSFTKQSKLDAFLEDKNKWSLGQTYTISENMMKTNIKNASELERSNELTGNIQSRKEMSPRYSSSRRSNSSTQSSSKIEVQSEVIGTNRSSSIHRNTNDESFASEVSEDVTEEVSPNEEIIEDNQYADSHTTSNDSVDESIVSSKESKAENIETLMNLSRNCNFGQFDSSISKNSTFSAGQLLFGSSMHGTSNILQASNTLSVGQLVETINEESESGITPNSTNSNSSRKGTSKSPLDEPSRFRTENPLNDLSAKTSLQDGAPQIPKKVPEISEEELTISNISEKINALLQRRKSLPRQRLNTDSVSSYAPSDMEDCDFLEDDIFFEGDFVDIEKELKNLS